MGPGDIFQYALIVALGVVVARFYSRPTPVYPTSTIYQMFLANPMHNGTDAEGMVAIVTGSTSGIGKRIAVELFRYGATVVIASRNRQKSLDTMEEIKSTYPGSKGRLVFEQLDTSDLVSVRDFSYRVKERFEGVDFLVSNAGIHYGSSTNQPLFNMSASVASAQGYDLAFATNYLGHFLLTHLLLPNLRLRVVNIASIFHFQGDSSSLDPAGGTPRAALGHERGFEHRLQAYGVSKLAQVLHSSELQRRLAPGLRVVSVCPGWVKTSLLSEDLPGWLLGLNAFDIDQGILSPMVGLFDPSLRGGEFLTNSITPLSRWPSFDLLLRTSSEWGLRDAVGFLVGLSSNILQGFSYGHRVHRPSPEARNATLAAALYDWTLEELQRGGFAPV
jgi:NAD(P)-dependent dehydrogenase (short-subunit alcohol dehydrogenase family)